MSAMAKALWFVAPGRVELREQDLGEPGPSEVLAKGLFSALSWGTERHLFAGTGPVPFDPSLDPPGAPTYPRRYGYAWVGEVQVGALAAGTRVFALATHADAHVLSRERVRPLPASLPPLRATLAASLETAITVVWDARIGLGDHVLVLGGGSIGTLCAWLARRAGAARVHVVEPSAARSGALRALGLSDIHTPSEFDPVAARALGFDVVVEATGEPSALDTAILCVRREGRVVVASFYGQRTAPIALGERFHRERLTLISSQVSLIPEHKRARFDHDRRFTLVLELLTEDSLDALFDPPVPFPDAALVYERGNADRLDHKQIAFAY
jgi:2-desacetyl-2-hydroxyethyl bacteriochlorophyllide A dehydrogenase